MLIKDREKCRKIVHVHFKDQLIYKCVFNSSTVKYPRVAHELHTRVCTVHTRVHTLFDGHLACGNALATDKERAHLLKAIVVTAAVFHVDTSWLNTDASRNTAREGATIKGKGRSHKISERV